MGVDPVEGDDVYVTRQGMSGHLSLNPYRNAYKQLNLDDGDADQIAWARANRKYIDGITDDPDVSGLEAGEEY